MSKISVEENMIYQAQCGDKTAMIGLIEIFTPVVEVIASRNTELSVLTRGDLIQEGMIGLLSAVYGYKPDGGAGFVTYATVCITNAVLKAVRDQNAKKHMPLNDYVSFSDILAADCRSDPQTTVEMRESVDALYEKIRDLSDIERNVVRLRMSGYDRNKIADILSVDVKSVDNALQRARKKLREN